MKYEITPMTLDNPGYKEFYSQVQENRVQIANGARIEFHMPMPDDWTEATKIANKGTPHTETPLLNQLIRSLLSAVECYRQSTIWKLGSCEKRWAYTGYIMIFNDDEK